MSAADSPRATRLPREQRRQQVLAAALEVFSASGYHSASMDDIADRAGVSKPVLYQHFPGKLDLYLALLDAATDELIAASDAALGSTTDNHLRVIAMTNAYFAFIDDPAGAFRLVFESDLANEPSVRDRVDAADQAVARRIAHVIAEDTGLSDDQAMLLAYGLQGMTQVAARRWARDESAPAIRRPEAVELISALGWRGISGFPLSHPPADAD